MREVSESTQKKRKKSLGIKDILNYIYIYIETELNTAIMMKEEALSIKWKETLPYVSMKTAYDSVLQESEDVVMCVEICIDPDHTYGGWYETYDEETGGEYHAEGVLEVTWDAETGQPWLNGYDGCFELPDYIVRKLVENGVKDNL